MKSFDDILFGLILIGTFSVIALLIAVIIVQSGIDIPENPVILQW